jgi:hypothetical protein
MKLIYLIWFGFVFEITVITCAFIVDLFNVRACLMDQSERVYIYENHLASK